MDENCKDISELIKEVQPGYTIFPGFLYKNGNHNKQISELTNYGKKHLKIPA